MRGTSSNRLTINAGVRGDMLQGGGKSGGNVYSSSNWAPRLGAAVDVAGDNRTVIKGSYGIYYEGSQAQLFERALPGMSDYITYLVNADGSLGRYQRRQAVRAVQSLRRYRPPACGRGDDRLRTGA